MTNRTEEYRLPRDGKVIIDGVTEVKVMDVHDKLVLIRVVVPADSGIEVFGEVKGK